jgi:phage terminase small subunit
MGRRGPKPKSPTLKILEGNAGRRALEDGSPQVPAGIPRVPGRYDKPARCLWKNLGKRLADAGILTQLDTFALELLVDAQLEYASAQKNFATTGPVRLEKAAKQLRTMLREFGLTPASRSSVKAAAPDEAKETQDPAKRYFA